MELTVKQKNKKYRGAQNTCAPLTVLSVTRIQHQTSLVYNIQRHYYTQLDVTNILASVSRLYSFVLKGHSQVCVRAILRKNEMRFAGMKK